MPLGPEIERIAYASGGERTQARKEFWNVVNSGHGLRSWQSTSMRYWNLVKDDHSE